MFLLLSIFFLIWCENNINEQKNIDNKKIECDSSMNLWKNKFYNFSMCLPSDYLWYGAYWHSINFDKKLNTFVVIDNEWKQYIDDSDITIGRNKDSRSNRISLYWCFWKKSKKYLLWKLEVFDCIDEDTKKYKSTEFNFKDDIFFSFDKNNNEHIKIINSIKPLTEK